MVCTKIEMMGNELKQKIKEVEEEKAVIASEKRAIAAEKSNLAAEKSDIAIKCRAVKVTTTKLTQENIAAITKSFKDCKLDS